MTNKQQELINQTAQEVLNIIKTFTNGGEEIVFSLIKTELSTLCLKFAIEEMDNL